MKPMKFSGTLRESWWAWNGPQRLGKDAEGIGNQWKNRDYSEHSLGKIC